MRGKNLQAMVSALQSGTADFIQEYHPELWNKPADDAPIIEHMEIIVKGESPDSFRQPGKPTRF